MMAFTKTDANEHAKNKVYTLYAERGSSAILCIGDIVLGRVGSFYVTLLLLLFLQQKMTLDFQISSSIQVPTFLKHMLMNTFIYATTRQHKFASMTKRYMKIKFGTLFYIFCGTNISNRL